MSSATDTDDRFKHQKANVVLLALSQAVASIERTISVTTGPMVGLMFGPSKSMATIPTGMGFVTATMMSVPAAFLMQRFGRRPSFALASLVGVSGGLICTAAIFHSRFVMFVLGASMIGIYQAFTQQYRFAAAETATPLFKSKAVSFVLAGGALSPFVGSWLANTSRDVFDPAFYAGCYAVLASMLLVAAVLATGLRMPPIPPAATRSGGRPLRAIVRQQAYIVALLGATLSHSMRNNLMISTSLAMRAEGFAFADITFVIKWHIFSMYGSSFFTGSILQRFGCIPTMLAGAALLTSGALSNLMGATVVHHWTAMVLLGVGWNLMFVSATRLLVDTYRAEERAKAQGFNDLIVFGTMSTSALTSGTLFDALGWTTLNLMFMPALVVAAGLAAHLHFRMRAQRSSPAPA